MKILVRRNIGERMKEVAKKIDIIADDRNTTNGNHGGAPTKRWRAPNYFCHHSTESICVKAQIFYYSILIILWWIIIIIIIIIIILNKPKWDIY